MEFYIDIDTGLNGNITIKDYSKKHGQYFSEDETVQEHGRYKYSECKTLNIITKIECGKVILIDILLHDHDQFIEDSDQCDLELTKFTIKKDGYYNINHIVLPTIDWYNNTYLNETDEYKESFKGIYLINENNEIIKYSEEFFEECSIKEIIERNNKDTTIEKCIIDIFYTGFLQLCYINYCKKLFTKLTKTCKNTCIPENIEDLTYTRDFLWMVLNIIDYQISFKLYMEALRILEITNYCGNFCQNQELNAGPSTGCGCSQNRMHL